MIVYNGQEYDVPVVNDAGVGEFTSNSGKKDPTGSNNERFNDYQNNTTSGGSYLTITGSHNSTSGGANCIVTGYGNTLSGSYESLICGSANRLTYFKLGVLSGSSNYFYSSGSKSDGNIISGNDLYISGSNIYDNIINGERDTTGTSFKIGATDLSYNIINGYEMNLQATTIKSNIINGSAITASGNTINYNIINGYSNSSINPFYISGDNILCNYINGINNTIGGSTTINNIITGQSNTTVNASQNLILGSSNTMSGGNGGYSNTTIGNSNKMAQISDYHGAAAHSDPQYDTIIGDNNFVAGIRNTTIGMNQCVLGQGNIVIGQFGNGELGSEAYDSAFKSSDRKTFLDTYYPVAVPTGNANSGIVEGHYCYKEGNCTILGYNPGNDSNQGLPLYVHIEGHENVSIGTYNHIEGWGNLGNCAESHIEGRNNLIADITTGSETSGTLSDTGTTSTAGRPYSTNNHMEGTGNKALHIAMGHIEGNSNKAISTIYSHLEGVSNQLQSDYGSHIEGESNTVQNQIRTIHIEGNGNIVSNNITYSHIEGESNTVESTARTVHVEGENNTIQYGVNYSHIEGSHNLIASGSEYNHNEGYYNTMNGGIQKCHAEGSNNTLYGGVQFSHVEGADNRIDNGSQYTHIEGKNNQTNNIVLYGHAEGWGTQIMGAGPHAQNLFTAARSKGQTAMGIANIPDTANTYALIIGNGSYTPTSLSEYDAESTYNTDDEVIYNGKVYKCLEDGVTGTWDSTKWDLETTEIIDGQEITRSNALTLDWSGNLTTIGNVTANGVTLTNANPNISDEYDDTITYAVGSYCIHNNTLYKCTTAVTIAEDFDSAKWTVTTISSELLSLKSAIDALAAQLNGFTFNSLISQSDYDNLVATGTVDANTIYPIPES